MRFKSVEFPTSNPKESSTDTKAQIKTEELRLLLAAHRGVQTFNKKND
jgi:hypothetical protein